VGQWRASGLTAGEFARRHGLSEQSLRWWAWRLGTTLRESGAAARRGRKKPTPEVSPLTFVEMTGVVQKEPLEVVLVNGVRVRVPADFEQSSLERLLDVVERRG
jgi:hypothetical protein